MYALEQCSGGKGTFDFATAPRKRILLRAFGEWGDGTRVNEYLAKRLLQEGSPVFGITGGCAINIFDAMHKAGINLIPLHHEQACAMAADAYAKVSGKLGICAVTSGPGATNLITGTCCSFYDSTPVLSISGQVPSKHLSSRHDKIGNLRQYGFQETDVQRLFKSITKYAVLIDHGEGFVDLLETAIISAKTRRPGPTIIDICDDVQREDIGMESSGFPVIAKDERAPMELSEYDKSTIDGIIGRLSSCKHPLLILGQGVHAAKCEKEAVDLVERLNIPVFLTWGALDLLDDGYSLNMRDFGVTSQRAGNFAMQNSDVIISLGTKLDTHEVADYAKFAPNALKLVVDIDGNELAKLEGTKTYTICADLKMVLAALEGTRFGEEKWSRWVGAVRELKVAYPIYDGRKGRNGVNPYAFMNYCSKVASNDCVVVTDAGQTLTWTMQGWKVKKGQRLITAFNHSPMGYSLPASIGAYCASKSRVVCMIGDGGLQMNIQELPNIAHNCMPITIFVLNNGGYGMIRQTQSDWNTLSPRIMCDSESGLGFPDLKKLAIAHDIKYERIESEDCFPMIQSVLEAVSGPCLCEVKVSEEERIEPKLKFGDSFENQRPYLGQDKINSINRTLDGI